MKILIATPTYGYNLDSRMVGSFLNALKICQENNIAMDWDRPSSPMLAHNRNICVDHALKDGYDWILFWDADQVVEGKNWIKEVMDLAYVEGHAGIIGLPARLKVEEKIWNFGVKKPEGYVNFKGELPKLPTEVDVIGTGVMFIHREVLQKIPPPWFSFTETYHDKPGFFPEDWLFCEKVKEAGYKIIMDPRFLVKHYGSYSFE